MVAMAGMGIVTALVTLFPITTLIPPMGTTLIFITVIIGEAIVDQQGDPPEKRDRPVRVWIEGRSKVG